MGLEFRRRAGFSRIWGLSGLARFVESEVCVVWAHAMANCPYRGEPPALREASERPPWAQGLGLADSPQTDGAQRSTHFPQEAADVVVSSRRSKWVPAVAAKTF